MFTRVDEADDDLDWEEAGEVGPDGETCRGVKLRTMESTLTGVDGLLNGMIWYPIFLAKALSSVSESAELPAEALVTSEKVF